MHSSSMFGLATVHRQASNHPEIWTGWRQPDMDGVEELPVGCCVIRLSAIDEDLGWAPVVYISPYSERACFTWVHPQCLVLDSDPQLLEPIRVGHVKDRNKTTASHPSFKWCKPRGSVGYASNTHYLDARFEDNVSFDSESSCSGHCFPLCCETAGSSNRMAVILRFAALRKGGLVFCSRGKHRSVAAANILEFVFGRRIDYGTCYYPPRNCHECGDRMTSGRVFALLQAMRALPRDPSGLQLAVVLGLPP